MKLPDDPSKKESIESFKTWWHHRIHNRHGKNYIMPDFFEIWDARQSEIDALRQENEQLKNKIRTLEGT